MLGVSIVFPKKIACFWVGDLQFELPAIDLIFLHPRELLGDYVTADLARSSRSVLISSTPWAAETFPAGPSAYRYIRRQFGMDYTQDEVTTCWTLVRTVPFISA
jgi:hypothetical protein